jgi:hypothetical protein
MRRIKGTNDGRNIIRGNKYKPGMPSPESERKARIAQKNVNTFNNIREIMANHQAHAFLFRINIGITKPNTAIAKNNGALVLKKKNKLIITNIIIIHHVATFVFTGKGGF